MGIVYVSVLTHLIDLSQVIGCIFSYSVPVLNTVLKEHIKRLLSLLYLKTNLYYVIKHTPHYLCNVVRMDSEKQITEGLYFSYLIPFVYKTAHMKVLHILYNILYTNCTFYIVRSRRRCVLVYTGL